MRSLSGEHVCLSQIFSELFNYVLRQLIGDDGFAGGCAVAFVLWCADYARLEWSRRRIVFFILLVALSCASVSVVLFLAPNRRVLPKYVVVGAVFYAPIAVAMRRSTKRKI